MPIFRYFLWTGLALCGLLYGASAMLGPDAPQPAAAQNLPLKIQQMRAADIARSTASRPQTPRTGDAN